MSKPALIRQIRSLLEEQLTITRAAAENARENATGDETKSDGKYDTRAIEAAYLAGAQAEQAEKLADSVRLLTVFDPAPYDEDDGIGAGALVETEHDGKIVFYFLTPAGGGHTVEYDGFDCTVLTPESPLYQDLLGSHTGDLLEGSSVMILGVS
ncbi:MAG: transcription elongation factor GreAB [Verrucomicrobiota bacterium]|nr:transcription elongation factor GreAB [Verrucomicrobiota bacterium]